MDIYALAGARDPDIALGFLRNSFLWCFPIFRLMLA